MRERSRKRWIQSAKVGTICLVAIVWLNYYLSNTTVKLKTGARIDKNETKLVLLATKRFGLSDWYLGDQIERKGFVFDSTGRNCIVTADPGFAGGFSRFDGVLFHGLELSLWGWLPRAFHFPERTRSQKFIFFTAESPERFPLLWTWRLRDFFNATMTYRTDGDIRMSYGMVESNQRKVPEIPTKVINASGLTKEVVKLSTRPKLVYWAVSNCDTPSMRENFVHELKKFVQVDVFGQCGDETEVDFGEMRNEYKFYLSFENSMCEDYVTEKFFRALNDRVLPIVLGGANYSKFAPAHSYIDVRDFSSAEDLGKYLVRLNEHPEEYLAYFWWTEYYHVSLLYADNDFRNICKFLHTNPRSVRKSISDIGDYWRNRHGEKRPACVNGRDLYWSGYDAGRRRSLVYLLKNFLLNLAVKLL